MALLITGGGGFVMSNLARLWLERHPEERVVVLDSGPRDEALARFFAPVADRLEYVRASVLDRSALRGLAETWELTRIVHAATVTLFATETPDGAPLGNPEWDAPGQMLEVNFNGSVNVLELARTLPGLKSFINVSSGAVYNDTGPEPPGPMPEDGWVDPPEFYGIAKLAGELATRRYGELFGIKTASCRLSGVYGPMDRRRPSRAYYCPPYVVVHKALEGARLRINAPEAVGDHLHSQDVARAIMALLEKEEPFGYPVYNIAYGEAVTMRELIAMVAGIIPQLEWEVAPDDDCDIVADDRFTGGRWGAYDISRIAQETGWRPRPLREALADYVGFIRGFGATP